MIGEVSIGGVYLPALLFLGLVALIITSALIRLLSIVGVYRLVAARPWVDLSIFIIILWTAAEVAGRP
jgi:uncharacterized protein DUF1656